MRAAFGAALLLAVSSALHAAGVASLEFRFIGNAAFLITDGKTTLFTDFPYKSGAFGYMRYDISAIPAAGDAACLISHGHLDHFDSALFAKTKMSVIGPPAVTDQLPTDRVIPFGPRIAWRDIQIQAFATPHGDIAHYSYLVTWHGLRVYFTGDTDSSEQLLAMRGLDAAFVSPWLIESIAKQRGRIDCRLLVAYHHRADEKVIFLQNRKVPRQGETLVIEGRGDADAVLKR